MFTNTSFEAINKTLKDSAEKFSPAAVQDAVKPVIDNVKAWGDLAQKQVQVATAAVAENVEAFKSIKEPQAAFEVLKSIAENCVAMATKNFKDVTALSVVQFNAAVDSLGKNAPAPEAFAGVAKGLKAAAATIENAFDSALKTGGAAAPAPAAAAKLALAV